ncbi:MAG: signal peptidase I [Thermoprotei archaeon]|nr:signal peptidase I [Thermoprotei archaeon]
MIHIRTTYIVLVILTIACIMIPRYAFPRLLGTSVPLDVVESGSMEPELHIGDLLVAQGIRYKDIKVGLIIVFKRPSANYLIVHRVYAIHNKAMIITKGDNNPFPDPFYITSSDVKGVVIARIPLVGYLTLVFRLK